MMNKTQQKHNDSQVSVVIITKDRQLELSECLGSLAVQFIPPDEVIIIDSSSNKSSEELVKTFQNTVKFPVHYFLKQNVNYGVLRNEGVRRSNFSWIAFLDDDCVAEKNWFSNFKQHIKKEQFEVAVGNSDTYYNKNDPSLTTNFLDRYWKMRRIDDQNNILDFEITDTKNLLVNKNFLLKNKIFFQEHLEFDGKGEDCRFGLDLQKKEATGKYFNDVKVFHKDAQNWTKYYQKLFTEIRAYRENVAKEKQKMEVVKNIRLQKVPFRIFFNDYSKKQSIKGLKKFLVLCNVALSVALFKSIRLFHSK